jgi:hypothetical protein
MDTHNGNQITGNSSDHQIRGLWFSIPVAKRPSSTLCHSMKSISCASSRRGRDDRFFKKPGTGPASIGGTPSGLERLLPSCVLGFDGRYR